jgi:hypothetical protein
VTTEDQERLRKAIELLRQVMDGPTPAAEPQTKPVLGLIPLPTVEELAEVILDWSGAEVARVNNEGTPGQMAWLRENGCTDSTIARLVDEQRS